MKITVTYEEMYDFHQSMTLRFEGGGVDCSLSFHDGEPEDNSLMRNFSDVYEISALLVKAHAAGKAGEPVEVVVVDENKEEQE